MDLKDFFKINNKVAIAYSGGVDSSYLLVEAINNNCEVIAFYILNEFQATDDYNSAIEFLNKLKVKYYIIRINSLESEQIINNDKNRCYYCKKQIMTNIVNKAKELGFNVVLDGTNASDDEFDRPGMKVLKEFNIFSPLKEANLTKTEIRERAKQLGIEFYNKPSNSCLATRVMFSPINKDILFKIEKVEMFLRSSGYLNCRARAITNDSVLLQVKFEEINKLKQNFSNIKEYIENYFKTVHIDENGRK